MPKTRRSRRDWQALLDEFERSGLSVTAFADAHQLNLNTLKWWRTQLKREPLTLVRVPTFTAAPTQLPGAPPLGAHLAGGMSVEAPAGAGTPQVASFLARLARELQT